MHVDTRHCICGHEAWEHWEEDGDTKDPCRECDCSRFTDFVRQFAEEAAPLFQQNHWQWTGIGVPTVDDIEKMARGLLREVFQDEGDGVSSGRIVATVGRGGVQRLHIPVWRSKEPLVSCTEFGRAPGDGERET